MDIESSRIRLEYLRNGNLNEDTKKCQESTLITLPLKPHQKTMLAHMIDLETGKIPIRKGCNIHTSIGICADGTGAGKSLEMLSCIAQSPSLNCREKVQIQFGNMVHLCSTYPTDVCSHLNLIVVPHSCVQQWNQYIRQHTKLKQICITRRNQIENFKVQEVPTDVQIVLISNTMYNDFTNYIKCAWSRVIFDEADSIHIPNTNIPQANFIWFITSSLQNLMFPSGMYFVRRQLEETNRTIITRKYMTGIKRQGFIRDTFRMLERPEANAILKYIILKNDDKYVKESYNLPVPEITRVECRTPTFIHMVDGFISNEIMEMLNAGNIEGAIEKTGVNIDTSENIVAGVTQQFQVQLNNLRLQYSCVESMEYIRISDKDKKLKTLEDEIAKVNETISSIKERIESYKTSICPICYDIPSNPVTLTCCKNIMCFECITRCMKAKQNCPMCRDGIHSDSLIAIGEEKQKKKRELPSKNEALLEILQNQGKFLVFSAHDQSFKKVEEMLQKSKKAYLKLVGNSNRISNIINQYKNGDVEILLLNSSHYGTGLNLENTTDLIFYHKMNEDMERQVIGRAQRIGRTSKLKIHYLLQENEKIS